MTASSGFQFGKRSRAQLATCQQPLVLVARLALELTTVDFCVVQGLRTEAEQRRLVASGASRTMKSRHLPDPDTGLANAMDLAPCVGRTVRWDWPLFYPVAHAVQWAAAELGVVVRWGGVWDRRLHELSSLAGGLEQEVADYVRRWQLAHPAPQGPAAEEVYMAPAPFLDGPHFELPA